MYQIVNLESRRFRIRNTGTKAETQEGQNAECMDQQRIKTSSLED